jgi:Fibronectin type III domain
MNRRRYIPTLSLFLVATVALVLMVAAPKSWAAQIQFSKAKIIFEFNSSGPDLGIQVSLDGEPWNEITVVDPKGGVILEIEAAGRLKTFGLTELFAESNEPNFEDVTPKDILARFPAGKYKFFGATVEGDKLMGTATLTHAIPDGPSNVAAQAGPGNTLVISWVAPPTVSSLTGLAIKIVGYQVVVERADNDQLGAATRIFDVKLPNVTNVTVPPEFLEPGKQYKFEVLAIEAGGNQSITEGEPFVF